VGKQTSWPPKVLREWQLKISTPPSSFVENYRHNTALIVEDEDMGDPSVSNQENKYNKKIHKLLRLYWWLDVMSQ
jgi:hypothetical protein